MEKSRAFNMASLESYACFCTIRATYIGCMVLKWRKWEWSPHSLFSVNVKRIVLFRNTSNPTPLLLIWEIYAITPYIRVVFAHAKYKRTHGSNWNNYHQHNMCSILSRFQPVLIRQDVLRIRLWYEQSLIPTGVFKFDGYGMWRNMASYF